jgi:activator of HSP90 ATPase
VKEKTRTIRQTVFLPVQPAEVYDAFLKAKKHAGFTQSKATCDARIGGKFTAYDGYIFGTILKLEEGRRIVQEWQTTEWPESAPPSIAEFTFKEKKGGTEVTMVHSNVPQEQAESYRQGWIDYYWEPLKVYFNKR